MQILVGFGFNSDEHLRDNYCFENDYDTKTKLSIIFSKLHWCPSGSHSSDDPQENKSEAQPLS